MPNNNELTERSLIDEGKPVRPCDWQHMITASAANPAGTGLHSRHFTTPSGSWLEVRWLCDHNGHVEYVYEDTRGLNRPAAHR